LRRQGLQKTITHEGVTRTLREWHSITGVRLTTLHSRHDAGWPPAQVLGFEKRPDAKEPRQLLCYDGRRQTLGWWAKFLGYPRSTLESRLNAGYPVAQVLGFEPLDRTKSYPRSYYRRSDGLSHTMEEWSKVLGRAESTLRARLRRGWSVDETLGLGKHKRGSPPVKRSDVQTRNSAKASEA
jgi:hypothetical protein